MSCILRACGTDFDATAFLVECELQPVNVSLKGELRFPASQPKGPRFFRSSVNFEASPADFSELDIQIRDVLSFVLKYEGLISRLQNFPGVETLTLDFGAEIHPPGWCSFSFPSELLLALGKLGITLGLSVYPIQEDEQPT
jgi:hypothetical protein